jgi:hypothetical protein
MVNEPLSIVSAADNKWSKDGVALARLSGPRVCAPVTWRLWATSCPPLSLDIPSS